MVQAMESINKNKDIVNELLFKLERNRAKIKVLLGRLNSYTCEPTNYECFERLRDLRDDIAALKVSHLELSRNVDAQELDDQQTVIQQMQDQIDAFNELDHKIGTYFLDTKGYQ